MRIFPACAAMFCRPGFLLLFCLASPGLAAGDEPALPMRASARLLNTTPAAFLPGQCVLYRETATSGILGGPVYFLRGEVLASTIRRWHLAQCPQFAGKGELARYSREEFTAHARAHPCVSAGQPERDEMIGMVRLRVLDWETAHERRMANMGRLYRGHFLDQRLQTGEEIELETDQLVACK